MSIPNPSDPTERLTPKSNVTPRTEGISVPRPPEVEKAAADAGNAFGRYVKVALLGRGGGGEVWKAYEPNLSRWVALKLLHGTSDEEIARFVREAQTAAQLSHPNIAAIYEVGLEMGRHYLAMQFVEGTTLRTAGLGAREAARVVRDAARGVAHAHSKGIVHRDLKPDNLMISKDHLYVLDFGLARTVEGGTKVSVTGTVVGTPAYMPPEQARAGKVDGRADVYSLGATLYELLAGKPPFEGPTIFAVLKKVEEDEPAPLDGDRDLDTIALKCLEKDPARRYQTADELAGDLDRWLNGEPIHAHPPSLAYRVRKGLGRRKAVVAVVVLALAAGGFASALIVPAYLRSTRTVALWKDVSVVLAQAEMAMRVGDRDRARALIATGEERCRKYGDLAAAQYFTGRLRAVALDRTGAIEAMERASILDASFQEPRLAAGILRAELYLATLRRMKMRATEGGPNLAEQEEADPAIRSLRERALADLAVDVTASEYVGEADRSYARGILAHARGLFGDAREAFAAALRQDPSHVGALLGVARIDIDESRFDDAAAGLDRVISLHRGLGEALRFRASLRLRTFRATGREYDEAVREASRAIELEPVAEAYAIRATLEFFHGEHEAAVKDFSEAIRLDPNRQDLYLNRALANQSWAEGLVRLGRTIEAIAAADASYRDLDVAVALQPKSARALANRGVARLKRGDVEGAMQDFDTAIRHDPACVDAWINRGMLHYDRGDVGRALEDCDRAVALAKSADAHARRSIVRQAAGDSNGALEDAVKAIELDPRNVTALVTYGMEQAVRGDAEKALEAFNTAIRVDPDYWPAYIQRARLYERGQQTKEAFEDYEHVLKRSPKEGQALFGRGVLRMRSNDLDGAIEDFSAAIAVNPRDHLSLANRGIAHLNRKEKTAAIEDFRRALKAAPAKWTQRAQLEEMLKTAESD